MQELEHYFVQSAKHRKTCPPPEVSLELLRKAFFGFAGIPDTPVESQVQKAGGVKVKKEEMEAWLACGQPSPFNGWLESYRNERRRHSSQAES